MSCRLIPPEPELLMAPIPPAQEHRALVWLWSASALFPDILEQFPQDILSEEGRQWLSRMHVSHCRPSSERMSCGNCSKISGNRAEADQSQTNARCSCAGGIGAINSSGSGGMRRQDMLVPVS